MKVVRGFTIVAAAMFLALVAAPRLASAHARYKSSTPGTSEVLQTAPTSVTITFTEEIQKVSDTYNITVTDSSGAIANSGPAVINEQDRTTMSAPLADTLPPGRYVVHYNNVSDADGDPFAGAFAFYVQVQPTAADKAADAALAAAEAPEATGTAGTGAATATAGPTTGPATPLASPTATSSSGGGGNNTGLYIVVGVIVAVVLVAAGGVVVYRGRRGA